MKFYFTPGSCSTGIHILLEELDLLFEAHLVNLMKGEQNRPEFLAMNPKASIPVLVLPDGTALTDFVSIAWWLAKTHPRGALLPESLVEEAQILGQMNFVINTIHGQGFTRIFTTGNYTTSPIDTEKVKSKGKEIVVQGLKIVDDQLQNSWSEESPFTIADAALFYVEFWAVKSGIPLPAMCDRHYHHLLKRRSVRQVLMEEGYHSTLKSESGGESSVPLSA